MDHETNTLSQADSAGSFGHRPYGRRRHYALRPHVLSRGGPGLRRSGVPVSAKSFSPKNVTADDVIGFTLDSLTVRRNGRNGTWSVRTKCVDGLLACLDGARGFATGKNLTNEQEEMRIFLVQEINDVARRNTP